MSNNTQNGTVTVKSFFYKIDGNNDMMLAFYCLIHPSLQYSSNNFHGKSILHLLPRNENNFTKKCLNFYKIMR